VELLKKQQRPLVVVDGKYPNIIATKDEVYVVEDFGDE
jgi:hypothetical protein